MRTAKHIKDPEEAVRIADKAISLIVDHPKNLSIIKNANKDYIRSFIREVAEGKIEDYFVIGFFDDDELVGACLLSIGNPWYDPTLRIINEEFTVSFKRGAGIARSLSKLLKGALDNDLADFVQTGSVNDWCAPMLKNTYKGEGFHIYNQYYLSKEDLKDG